MNHSGSGGFKEFDSFEHIKNYSLTLGNGSAFCAGSKSSKKVVSREEAIAIIDEQYRCVFPCLFLFVCFSWLGISRLVVRLMHS